jgi:hypothetical protein
MFFIIVFIASAFNIYSQTKATTENGTEVILFDDGTWEDSKVVNRGDCKELIKLVETNETTGFMSEKPLNVDSGKLTLSITSVKNGNVIVVSMTIEGDKKLICIGPDDKVVITKNNGKEIELPKLSAKNCKGEYTLFIGKPWKTTELIETLSSGQIKSIKVKSYEFEFKFYQSTLFQKTLNCLDNVEINK